VIIALDVSLTSTGWARTDASGSAVEVGVIRPKHRGVIRLQEILTAVCRVAKGCELALIEGYAYGRHNRAHQIGEAGGVVRLGLHQQKIPYVEVPPKCIKKLATSKGNAAKNEVLLAASRRLGYAGTSSDEADARWLLEFAAQHYELPVRTPLPKAHLGYMDEIEWPELEATG